MDLKEHIADACRSGEMPPWKQTSLLFSAVIARLSLEEAGWLVPVWVKCPFSGQMTCVMSGAHIGGIWRGCEVGNAAIPAFSALFSF